MSRATRNAADAHCRELQRRACRQRVAFITLTYRQVDGWSRRHVSQCLHLVRKWMEARGRKLTYEWVSELQQRGAVHYHLIVWMPQGLELPKFDRRGWWPHGFTKMEWARNPVGYVTKYASKLGTCNKFPKGLRLHGRGGMSAETARVVRYWVAPRYVREAFGEASDPARAVGGGWLDRVTGEWLAAMGLRVALTVAQP